MKAKNSILFDRWFLSASLLGTLIMGVLASYGTLPLQIAMVGTLVSVMAGVCLAVMQRIEQFSLESSAAMAELGLILPLTVDSSIRESYTAFVGALQMVHNSNSPAFRMLGRERMASLNEDFRDLARQRLNYVGTEGWRTAYAEILQDAALAEYRSVAWVRSDSYWQDQPGLQSLRINFELVLRGTRVTRIVVHRANASDENGDWQSGRITAWMKMQYKAGIRLLLIDERVLKVERDLLADFGIYGNVAVGILEMDDTSSKTLQFRLSFDATDLEVYREKWSRLILYATEWHPAADDHDPCSVQ